MEFLPQFDRGREVIFARTALLRLPDVSRAQLMEALRRFARARNESGSRLSTWVELIDGRLEGPGGEVEDAVFQPFPVASSSAGWVVEDSLVCSAGLVAYGAGPLRVVEAGRARVGWRFALKFPSVEVVPVAAGEPLLQLTRPVVFYVPVRDETVARVGEEHAGLPGDAAVPAGPVVEAFATVGVWVERLDVPTVGGVAGMPARSALAAAASGATARELLDRLAQQGDGIVRATVGCNAAAERAVLARLAEDPERLVRQCVAMNAAAPSATLLLLSLDSDSAVRAQASWNRRCPVRALRSNSRDPAWQVRFAVADNPRCPTRVLDQLNGDERWEVRAAAAANPSCSEVARTRAVNDERPEVRLAVRANPPRDFDQRPSLHEDPVGWLAARDPSTDAKVRRAYLHRRPG